MVQTQAYLLTLAIELPVVVGTASLGGMAPGRLCRAAVAALCASSLTHPLLWLADLRLAPSLAPPLRLGILEGLVVLVEAGVYASTLGLRRRTALRLSIVANLASFGLGLLL